MYSIVCSAAVSLKNIESWNDNKNPYREGFPEKDAKAKKRRVQLMEAIEEADVCAAHFTRFDMDGVVVWYSNLVVWDPQKELLLPVTERVNGLLKVRSCHGNFCGASIADVVLFAMDCGYSQRRKL